MAIITIAHKPDLTPEQAEEIFRKHFEGKYKVEPCESVLSLKTKYRDFQVVKNPVIGVALKLQQDTDGTKFVYGAVPPNRALRSISFGFAGLACMLFGGSLTKEVEAFIDSAPEFK